MDAGNKRPAHGNPGVDDRPRSVSSFTR